MKNFEMTLRHAARTVSILALCVALLLEIAAGPTWAQRQPDGAFDWEMHSGKATLKGEYVFEPGGTFRMRVLSIDPPAAYSGRWEMRQGNIVLHSQDGGEQTFRWDNNTLLLIANTNGMPAEPIVLKPRAGSSGTTR